MQKILLILFISLGFSFSADVYAGCGCSSSGCGRLYTAKAKRNPSWNKFLNSVGASPVSCERKTSCQACLYSCYNRSGQRGRAAPPGRSCHETGIACDFSPSRISRGTLLSVANKTLGNGRYKYIKHSAGTGGGHHIDNCVGGGGHKTYQPKSQKVQRYKQASQQYRSKNNSYRGSGGSGSAQCFFLFFPVPCR